MKNQRTRSQQTSAVEARAALEALFAPKGAPDVVPLPDGSLEGESLRAKKAADERNITSRIEFLRRKREALQEVIAAAAAAGLSIDEVMSSIDRE